MKRTSRRKDWTYLPIGDLPFPIVNRIKNERGIHNQIKDEPPSDKIDRDWITRIADLPAARASSGGCRFWGQSSHFDRAPVTAGPPRLADILSMRQHVSKVAKPEVT